MSLRRWLPPCLDRFLVSEKASSTLVFGLIALPLMASIGVGLDYSRMTTNRARMQSVIDSTALALAKVAGSTDQAAMQTRGDALVRAQFAGKPGITISSVTVTKSTRTIDIRVQASTVAHVARVIGRTDMDWGATTQVGWGVRKVEVALVLDNTGSMSSSGKMTQLKAAVHDLISILRSAATEEGSVKISIVPFDTTVNIGASYTSESWLTKSNIPSWQRPSWDGCVMDRNQSFDVNDTAYTSSNSSTRYPATMCPNSALAKVMPLSSDFDALNARVDEMQPSGNTNVTIGVVWGLATLSPQAPMTGALDFGTANLDKYMIVLTDGDNTENRWSTSRSSIDARTELACAAVKAQNVKVYTVRVINGNATLLSNCATSPSMYYDVDTATELRPVFQQIGNSIAKIRLTN